MEAKEQVTAKPPAPTTNQDDSDDEEYIPKPYPEDEFQRDLEYLQNHPLFIKDELTPEKIAGNPDLEALQYILHNDTPENIASHFNTKGNEYMVKAKDEVNNKYYLREAMKSYTEGIAQNSSNKDTMAKLYSNRSLIFLQAKSYRKTIDDCVEALKYNPKLIKPYFRAATAFYELHRYEECIKQCEKGLKIEPANPELEDLLNKGRVAWKKEHDKKQDAKKVKDVEKQGLVELASANKFIIGPAVFEVPVVDMKLYVDATERKLKVPIIISYPEFRQTDMIKAASVQDYLDMHLAEIFQNGLPWDTEEHYIFNKIEAYIELGQTTPFEGQKEIRKENKGKMKRIDFNKPIIEVLQTPDYVLPMLLEIIIVSPSSKFYDYFKKNNEFAK